VREIGESKSLKSFELNKNHRIKPVFHSRTILGGRNCLKVEYFPLKTLLFQQPIRLHKTDGKFRPLKIVREWKTGFFTF